MEVVVKIPNSQIIGFLEVFGKFNDSYDTKLKGYVSENEFKSIINQINKKYCNPRYYIMLCYLATIVGLAMTIYTFAKFTDDNENDELPFIFFGGFFLIAAGPILHLFIQRLIKSRVVNGIKNKVDGFNSYGKFKSKNIRWELYGEEYEELVQNNGFSNYNKGNTASPSVSVQIKTKYSILIKFTIDYNYGNYGNNQVFQENSNNQYQFNDYNNEVSCQTPLINNDNDDIENYINSNNMDGYNVNINGDGDINDNNSDENNGKENGDIQKIYNLLEEIKNIENIDQSLLLQSNNKQQTELLDNKMLKLQKKKLHLQTQLMDCFDQLGSGYRDSNEYLELQKQMDDQFQLIELLQQQIQNQQIQNQQQPNQQYHDQNNNQKPIFQQQQNQQFVQKQSQYPQPPPPHQIVEEKIPHAGGYSYAYQHKQQLPRELVNHIYNQQQNQQVLRQNQLVQQQFILNNLYQQQQQQLQQQQMFEHVFKQQQLQQMQQMQHQQYFQQHQPQYQQDPQLYENQMQQQQPQPQHFKPSSRNSSDPYSNNGGVGYYRSGNINSNKSNSGTNPNIGNSDRNNNKASPLNSAPFNSQPNTETSSQIAQNDSVSAYSAPIPTFMDDEDSQIATCD